MRYELLYVSIGVRATRSFEGWRQAVEFACRCADGDDWVVVDLLRGTEQSAEDCLAQISKIWDEEM